MILLDTNVISEPLSVQGAPIISTWLSNQVLETLYLSAITVAELRYGLAVLPDGKRKSGMSEDLENRLLPLFSGRILSFDDAASQQFAAIQALARRQGTPLGWADAAIAAIAKSHHMTVATRDTQPFIVAGVAIINPWETDEQLE
ncbi:MAG: type II toxin-antitoxin system VapC family toxin [Cardiobacteriaceae bacterium]|nr:type II toxin-antitoxin system VapC family toxin [Cardiobacteriaceae bacterium]